MLARAHLDRGNRSDSDRAVEESMTCRAELYKALPDEADRNPLEGEQSTSLMAWGLTRPVHANIKSIERDLLDRHIKRKTISRFVPVGRGKIDDVELVDQVLAVLKAEYTDCGSDSDWSRWHLRDGLRTLRDLRSEGHLHPVQDSLITACEKAIRNYPPRADWSNSLRRPALLWNKWTTRASASL